MIKPLDGIPLDCSFRQLILRISQLSLTQRQLITKGVHLVGGKIDWCAALVHICALQHHSADQKHHISIKTHLRYTAWQRRANTLKRV